MTTTQRRQVVTYLRAMHHYSARRACRLVGLARSRWQAVLERPRRDAPLVTRLLTLASERPRFGYERLHLLLRREGVVVNHKKVYRLYREAQLHVRPKRRRKRAAEARVVLPPALALNERWGMDFIHDQCVDGRRFRCLTMVDECSRESPVIVVDTSLRAARVIEALEQLAAGRGLPRTLIVDHGPEFISTALDLWAYRRGVQLHFIRPGKPTENAYIESFHSRFRDECLSAHWFESLTDARFLIERWRQDYNDARPHTSLGGLTPTEKARQLHAPEPHDPPPTRLSA